MSIFYPLFMNRWCNTINCITPQVSECHMDQRQVFILICEGLNELLSQLLQYFEAMLIDYLTDGFMTKAQMGEDRACGMKVWWSVFCFETRQPAGCRAFQVALCAGNFSDHWIVDLLATLEVHITVVLWVSNTSHHVMFITGTPIVNT